MLMLLTTTLLLSPPTPTTPTNAAHDPSLTPHVVQASPLPDSAKSSETLSDAEKIARVNRMIESARSEQKMLEAELNDPNSEYARAEAEFQELDAKVRQLTKEIDKHKIDNQQEEAARKSQELAMIKAEWETARDRFGLAIRQRKTILEKIEALKAQAERGQQWLARLERGETETAPAPSPVPVKPVTPNLAPTPATSPSPAAIVPPTTTPTTKPTPLIPLPGISPPLPIPTATPPTAAEPAVHSPEDPEIRRVRTLLQRRQQELEQAEAKARSAEERVQAIQNHIAIENRLLALEQEAAAQAGLILSRLTQQLAVEAPNDPEERRRIEDRIAEANRRLTQSNEAIQRITDHLAVLNESLRAVQQRQREIEQEAERKRREAEAEAAHLTQLMNPFTLRNLEKWFLSHGPNLTAILLGIMVLYMAVRVGSRKIVMLVANHHHRGSETDRENRVNTLVGVFRSMSAMAILGGGGLVLLDEAGLPIIPLMGGAAVLGLAVAFGAQNLIKDYFSGFMILMEDQYGVNDVVRIGSIAGQVERLTPRVTVLRDLEGVLHFIPHGTITNVSNLTHTWSRAMFDIPVPFDADLDLAMHTLIEVAQTMRNDPGFGGDVIDEPEMLGVDAYTESGIIIRFILKTRPLRQWAVKRELLRRIKQRFDQIGIQIPVPHRMLIHQSPNGQPGRSRTSDAAMNALHSDILPRTATQLDRYPL